MKIAVDLTVIVINFPIDSICYKIILLIHQFSAPVLSFFICLLSSLSWAKSIDLCHFTIYVFRNAKLSASTISSALNTHGYGQQEMTAGMTNGGPASTTLAPVSGY